MAERTGSDARTIVAGTIGTVLGWYEFSVYGYFAAQIGSTFFPKADPVAQVLAAFGIFAVGYVMRPVGGALTGHIGDRLGRRAALTFSVTAMSVPTVLVGLLPGYATLGLAAPVLLTFLRMLQGLSMGGEFTTALVFVVERAPAGRRGLIGAVAANGGTVGILLGSATGALIDGLLPAEAVTAWGWRIPFLFGVLVGLAGLWLRATLKAEPPAPRGHSPLLETVRHHLPLMARLAGLSVFIAVPFYISFLYIVTWLQTADGIAPARALEINTLSMILLVPVSIAAGWWSDRVGRKTVAGAGMALALVGALPFFWLMHHPDPRLILAGQFGFVVAVGLYTGAQAPILVEAVPRAVRCSVVALGYNVTLGLLGGMTPLAAAWLIDRTGNDYGPAYMIMAASMVSLTALYFHPETFRAGLADAAAE
jgi:MFS transporter, MHS family, proline/betaine transporter